MERDETLTNGRRPRWGERQGSAVAPVVVTPASAKSIRLPLLRFFPFPVFLGALLVAGIFVTVSQNLQPEVARSGHTNSLVEGDTWWHIAVGERILTTHNWPRNDSYSFTASGTDWIASEWLGEIALAVAARAGGLRALAVVLIALVGALFLLLYYYSYLRSGKVKAAFVACVAMLPLAAVCFNLRPQFMGYIFLLLTLICLERFRQGLQKTIWVLPAVFLLWVNTHGSFVFGLVALGVYWAAGLLQFSAGGVEAEPWTAWQRRHIALVFLLCLIALTVTPYGTRLAANPLDMALSQPVNIASVQEWQSMPFALLPGKIFLGMVLLFLVAQIPFRFQYKVEELALLVFAIYAACMHRRFILFFVLVFAPWLARVLARWVPGYFRAKDQYALNALSVLLIVAGIVSFFPSKQVLGEVVRQSFPQGAVRYLREHPAPGPIFNEYFWGGYLIDSSGGQQKVFIDGRADAYEHNGVHSDYLRIMDLDRQTMPLLRKYGIKACLIRRSSPLSTFLAALPDWRQVYADDVSVLFFCSNNVQAGRDSVANSAREKYRLSTAASCAGEKAIVAGSLGS